MAEVAFIDQQAIRHFVMSGWPASDLLGYSARRRENVSTNTAIKMMNPLTSI